MFEYGRKLKEGLKQAAANTKQNLVVQGFGPIVHTGFSDASEAKDYRDTLSYDKTKLNKLIAGMHDRGVRVIGRGLWYISAVHTDNDIEHAIETAEEVLAQISIR